MIATVIFYIILLLIFYTYFGYTLFLLLLSFFKKKQTHQQSDFEPDVTVFIAAYNERELIPEKVKNLYALEYPHKKIKYLWVTDGSNDGSEEVLADYPDMIVLHESARSGKIGAINRGMKFVKSPITIFCDANNFLSNNSIREIVALFANQRVGCVAGEKRIIKSVSDSAAETGEGTYWHYESLIKKLESDVNSTIGAAGELFAIRTELFSPVEPDALLDDFVISMRIAQQGYKIKYAPKAVATEFSSSSVENEMKRKIRIAAGGWQTLPRLSALLNPFKHGFLSFQYWSHKVLRWAFVPWALFLLLPLNLFIAITNPSILIQILLQAQILFYLFVIIGFIQKNKKLKPRFLFLPYYMAIMNISIILGFFRHVKGKQSVNWEKARPN